MSYGLRTWDENGNLLSDIIKPFGKVLGVATASRGFSDAEDSRMTLTVTHPDITLDGTVTESLGSEIAGDTGAPYGFRIISFSRQQGSISYTVQSDLGVAYDTVWVVTLRVFKI